MTPLYDSEADALYVTVTSTLIDHQVEMDDGVIVDVDDADRLVGIEILSPDSGWSWRSITDRFALSTSDATYLQILSRVEWRRDAEAKSLLVSAGQGGREGSPVALTAA